MTAAVRSSRPADTGGVPTPAQLALLRAVHGQPGVTRAAVARELGMPSGFAAETVARLVAAGLLAERPAPATGSRGRPTTTLHPHPDGPLVAVASVTQETWQVAVTELGGGVISSSCQPHHREQGPALAGLAAALAGVSEQFGARIQAVAVAVPGTVAGHQLIYAPNLGWHNVDLSRLNPVPGGLFLAGNDATFGAVAESRRGAGTAAGTLLYLHLAAGVGGAVVEGGQVVTGATGAAGEFGHMPFGDPGVTCRCGAAGCWNTTLDGPAVARALGQPAPADEVSYFGQVLAAAGAGSERELAAVRGVARSLGRGTAGLVNALDPDLVVIGGLGPALLDIARGEVTGACATGLMAFRASPPPPLVPAGSGPAGASGGAAEEAFAQLLTPGGLRAWPAR